MPSPRQLGTAAMTGSSTIVVCALYKFVTLSRFEELREPLLNKMNELEIRGTLLLATEGINGTVAANRDSVTQLLDWLREQPELVDIDHKESLTEEQPFLRTKVKLKKEIVTMGVEGIDPRAVVGTYIEPSEWNALISDPEVVLVDTRNDYEVQVGTFQNAINPKTTSFREFPAYVKDHFDPGKQKKIAMFCTGGIRCEKSTAYMKEQGFDEVYHLKGGILKYLEQVPEQESLWQGECFVFDDRVTVNHQLQKGNYDQCHACRLPITEQDKLSDHYSKGVSCPYCHDKTTPEQRQRFMEREKQIQLASRRGEDHMGSQVLEQLQQKREGKATKLQLQRQQETTNATVD